MRKTYEQIRYSWREQAIFDMGNIVEVGPLEFYMITRASLEASVRSYFMSTLRTKYGKGNPSDDTLWSWAFESGFIKAVMGPNPTTNDQRSVTFHWDLESRSLDGITVTQKALPRLYKRASEEYVEADQVIGAVLMKLSHGRVLYGNQIFYPFAQEFLVYAGENSRPQMVNLLNASYDDIAEDIRSFLAQNGYDK